MEEEFFSPKPRLGISACLLGEKVRYDGGNKRIASSSRPSAITLIGYRSVPRLRLEWEFPARLFVWLGIR